jgi:adenosylmethionine-8-amino-7-oxononanoate aminotransferase
MCASQGDAIFPRNFTDSYLLAKRGEGVYLFDDSGKRYLDACGGAAVVSIGHGVGEVVDAISRQAHALSYAHSSQFHTEVEVRLSQLLAEKFPGRSQLARVYFTSGGSEATETAIKIIRQYWLARREPQRQRIAARWHGYHGTTLGALAVSGSRKRRRDYQSLLPVCVEHISPCFCYHCWLDLKYPACELACAAELANTVAKPGEGEVAAFFFEPVVGATSGAPPAPGYLEKIAKICEENGVLLVADEIMTGAGRTGKYFASEHWGLVPDIILLGKGLASGYAPLGAVLVCEKVWKTIADAGRTLEHGFTYQSHPPAIAAGLAVQLYLERHGLVEQSRLRGEELERSLETLRKEKYVGDVRGKGLLQVIEIVQDSQRRQPFPAVLMKAKRLFSELRSRGVLVYPGSGTVDGAIGDHVLIAPPFIISTDQIEWLVQQIREAISAICDI